MEGSTLAKDCAEDWLVITSFMAGGPYHIETNPLIYRAIKMVTTWCGINTYKGGDTQSSSCETIKGWGENHQRAYVGFRWGFGRMTTEFCPVDWHTKWAWFGKKKTSEAAYFAVKGELTIVKYGQILLLEERHGLDVVDAVYWLYWQVSWNGHWLKIFWLCFDSSAISAIFENQGAFAFVVYFDTTPLGTDILKMSCSHS